MLHELMYPKRMPVRGPNEEKNIKREKEVWERHQPAKEQTQSPGNRMKIGGRSSWFPDAPFLPQEQRRRSTLHHQARKVVKP